MIWDYSYLIDQNGSLITKKNGQDLYVELKTRAGDFYIPVAMPRRKPELDFDLSDLSQDNPLWTYLDECYDKLEQSKIQEWVDKKLKSIGSDSVTDKLLKELLENFSVCYSCFFREINNPNPQKNIQYIRDRGFIVATVKQVCKKCNCKTTTYRLTPILSGSKQQYEIIHPKLKQRICQLFNYTDAYTGIQNPVISAHIPDHKFPEDRWDSDVPKSNSLDMTDEEIKKKFQLLNHQTNMQKQRFCGQCVKTGKRGYPFGIKYYYKGDENWDKNIPKKGARAELGCEGCGWYDIEKWRESLNDTLNKKGSR